ncbi:hypothetical protein [Luteimonas sp. e5]
MKNLLSMAALVCLLALMLAGCRDDEATADFTPLPRGQASTLSHTLVDGGVKQAIEATQNVVERGGIPSATRSEVLGYALDARRKSSQMRLDSNQFAQMLLSFGFPFEGVSATYGGYDYSDVLKTIDPEERQDASDEVSRQRRAAYEAAKAKKKAEEDAAKARHRARIKAITDPALKRQTAAHEAIRALSSASREEYGARIGALRREYVEAEKAVREVRARARELDEAFSREQHARWRLQKIEQNAAAGFGANDKAGRQLMELLAAWVRAAAAEPDHPDSFVPLYLAEMARLQADPIDLAEAPSAARHRWSLLEMALFASAFQPRPDSVAHRAAMPTLLDVLVPTAHASTPCEVAKEAWDSWKDVANTANGVVTNELLGRELKRLWGENAGKQISQAISSLVIVGKVISLASFYAHTQVTVESNVTQMHKPLGNPERVKFTARVGVSEEELKAYEQAVKEGGLPEQAIRDCLGWTSLPAADSIKDVAKNAENWILDWRLFSDPLHANWSRRDNPDARFFGAGRIGKRMKRVSGSSTESEFMIRILPERSHVGPVGNAKVEVRAEVDSAGLPSLETLVNAGKGVLGLTESFVDIASGWAREVFKPKAYAVLDLELHCPYYSYELTYRPCTDINYCADGREGPEGCSFVFHSAQEYEAWRNGWDENDKPTERGGRK